MATTVTKNEDGTYKVAKDTTLEKNLTKEQIQERIDTYKAGITNYEEEIAALESIMTDVETVEAEETAKAEAEAAAAEAEASAESSEEDSSSEGGTKE